jgi:glutamate racemase
MIGVLDSGVGGLSVLREIHRQFPNSPTLYFADQAYLPYGPRPQSEIRAFVEAIVAYLLAQGATVIVIACHAASAAGLHYLREARPGVPFVGVEPAVKPAAERTQTGVIGVLTTQATADGALYRRVCERHASHVRIITQVAPELVLLAEQGAPDTAASRAVIARSLRPLLDAQSDQVVLACTHFPFLMRLLQAEIGSRAALVDPSPAIARQVGRIIANMEAPSQIQRAAQNSQRHRYVTSGDAGRFASTIQVLLGEQVTAETVSLG